MIKITQQPANVTVSEWNPSSLNITFTTGSLDDTSSVQWYFRSASITNATTSVLSFTSTTASLSGYYFVTISSSSLGTSSLGLTSSQAFIQVNPLITLQPTNVIAIGGGPVSFVSSVSSSIPITSTQWYNGGNVMVGQTTNSLSIPSTYTAGINEYTIVYTTASGSVSSNQVSVEIIPMGMIIEQPTLTYNPYIAGTDGSHGAGYQWK